MLHIPEPLQKILNKKGGIAGKDISALKDLLQRNDCWESAWLYNLLEAIDRSPKIIRENKVVRQWEDAAFRRIHEKKVVVAVQNKPPAEKPVSAPPQTTTYTSSEKGLRAKVGFIWHIYCKNHKKWPCFVPLLHNRSLYLCTFCFSFRRLGMSPC